MIKYRHEGAYSHTTHYRYAVFIPSVYFLLVGSWQLQRDRGRKIISFGVDGGIWSGFTGKPALLGSLCRYFVASQVAGGVAGRVFGGVGFADGWWFVVDKILTA